MNLFLESICIVPNIIFRLETLALWHRCQAIWFGQSAILFVLKAF
jgi:hypothetical protein